MKDRYVISVKVVKSYGGFPLAESVQYWEYAQFDNCTFGSSYGSIIFHSVDSATEWWKEHCEEIMSGYTERYDMSTLAVRKVTYTEVKSLTCEH